MHNPEGGQIVTGTFKNYPLPRGADGAPIRSRPAASPACKSAGRGEAGEAGAIGSSPAVMNAIVDGLYREYTIEHIDMPETLERGWMAIREQQRFLTL